MKKLYKLAHVLESQQGIVQSIIASRNDKLLAKLSTIVFEQGKLTDKEAMILVIKNYNQVTFAKLKSNLKDIFYDTLLMFYNKIKATDSRAELDIVFENMMDTLTGRILIGKLHEDLGIELLEKAISRSLRFGITENILMQSRYLKIAYSHLRPNANRFGKYKEIQKKALKTFFWELMSENYFLELQNNSLLSTSNPSKDLKSKAKIYFDELNQINDIESPNFIYNKYRVQAIWFEYERDYHNLLKICEEAINYFKSGEKKTTILYGNIYIRKIFSLIQIGNYVEAIQFGNKIILQEIPGSILWVRISYYTIKVLIYESYYRESVNILLSIYEHTKLEKIGQLYFELLQTLLGYLHLLNDAGYLDLNSFEKNKLPEFRIGKFLNTTPIFSKDKRGINVSILLMHIAFLLQRKDYDAIIDRADSLNQYAYRYLRRDDSFRSNCMIKMVIQMTKADFNPVRTERYTADLLKQLKSVNLAGSGENIEIEVIPFEVLWDIMLKSLKN